MVTQRCPNGNTYFASVVDILTRKHNNYRNIVKRRIRQNIAQRYITKKKLRPTVANDPNRDLA